MSSQHPQHHQQTEGVPHPQHQFLSGKVGRYLCMHDKKQRGGGGLPDENSLHPLLVSEVASYLWPGGVPKPLGGVENSCGL